MCEVDLFDAAHIQAAPGEVFYSRRDRLDVRLGDIAAHNQSAYAKSRFAMLGCPTDEGVLRNGGRPGAAQAPTEIRRWLYRLTVNHLDGLALCDLGDTVAQSSLEATHTLHQHIVARIIRDGKQLIVLGGGNDIAYPDCAGLAEASGVTAAINIDAHFDVRADLPRNSGTPYRQLIDEAILSPHHLAQIGYQPFYNSPMYEHDLRQRGAHLVSLNDLRRDGVDATFKTVLSNLDAPTLFWGFDLDVVRASDAPGVSAPNPTGLTGDELCAIAAIAGADRRSRLVEFSEVNPVYDADGRTSRLAAIAIWHFLSQADRLAQPIPR